MTLTALVPPLRHGIPDPLDPDCWPSGTVAALGDVRIGVDSVLEEALRGGLPHVRLDQGHGIAVGAVLARLDGVGRQIDLVLDVPGAFDYCWYEARLLGRASSARTAAVRLSTVGAVQMAASALPRDVEAGDLIAVPFVRP